MATRPSKPTTISFPWRLYWQQLFSPNVYVKFISPFNFWRRYKIDHLETCRERDIIGHLQRCYHQQARMPKSSHTAKDSQIAENDSLGHLSPVQPSPQILLIVRPKIKLKYRGVAYDLKEVMGIQIAKASVAPPLVTEDDTALKNNPNPTDISNISKKN